VGSLDRFRDIWLVDFEFHQPDGHHPSPHCVVAKEYRTGRVIRLAGDQLRRLEQAPFAVAEESLIVAYYASADMSCFLQLGWPLPRNVLDLYAEFRLQTNGLEMVEGRGLPNALLAYGLHSVDLAQKNAMRQLALYPDLKSEDELGALLDYCQSDVEALERLLRAMEPGIDQERALLRGRFMSAAARMERTGVPIDGDWLTRIRRNWDGIKSDLISKVDAHFGVYEGHCFREDRFETWLATKTTVWPRLDSGRLRLDQKTFKDMAKIFPELSPLRELRHALGSLRLESIATGPDGRNRCLLSPFHARTGRNQPSNSKFIFGPSCWLRSLIRPAPGRALAYIDWAQQEYGIAAALSGDQKLLDAYRSGDPYLAFAKQIGAVPPSATKETHSQDREKFKTFVLAMQYLMGAKSLAVRLQKPVWYAQQLLDLHRSTYATFWRWSDSAVAHAMLHNYLYTVFGWVLRVGRDSKPRSFANFPMQANGAEMLRLACCFATERGIEVCCPVHDALLVEGPVESIEEVVHQTQQTMAEASQLVLGGFELRSEAKIVRYPGRYSDPRGKQMWDMVTRLVAQAEPPRRKRLVLPTKRNLRTGA
jgi:DNA polymerase I-like protein with 3'-5' exonuclease and polymerase domains